MTEISPLETIDDALKAAKFLNGLADAFEKEGNHVEAQRYRNLAKRQPELAKRNHAERLARFEKENHEVQLEVKRNQSKPLQKHERVDAVIFSPEQVKEIQARVKQMLAPSPNTAPTPPKSPTG